MVFKNPLKVLVQFSIILCTFFSYVYVIMANLKFYVEVHAYFSILACSVIQLDNSLNRLLQDAMYLNIFKNSFQSKEPWLSCLRVDFPFFPQDDFSLFKYKVLLESINNKLKCNFQFLSPICWGY